MELGAARTAGDGCRRFRPISLTFDSRSVLLAQEIAEDWAPEIKEQWRTNQSSVRMALLAELGTIDGEDKIQNYMQLGPAPWSVIFRHNELLNQIRRAYAHGDFYPSLVGACALGERLLNELLVVLRDDYVNHSATTRRLRAGRSITNWPIAISVLEDWQVIEGKTASGIKDLAQLRHRAVHFDKTVDASGPQAALEAIRLIQQFIEDVFSPHGLPPRFIADIAGASFFSLEAEQIPLVKRVFLPNCALLSPAHRMIASDIQRGGVTWSIYDDADYDPTPLSDEQFATAIPAGIAAMHADLDWKS